MDRSAGSTYLLDLLAIGGSSILKANITPCLLSSQPTIVSELVLSTTLDLIRSPLSELRLECSWKRCCIVRQLRNVPKRKQRRVKFSVKYRVKGIEAQSRGKTLKTNSPLRVLKLRLEVLREFKILLDAHFILTPN